MRGVYYFCTRKYEINDSNCNDIKQIHPSQSLPVCNKVHTNSIERK